MGWEDHTFFEQEGGKWHRRRATAEKWEFVINGVSVIWLQKSKKLLFDTVIIMVSSAKGVKVIFETNI